MSDERRMISIIVPVLNEAASLGRALSPLAGAPGSELIVVDGGSQDDTLTAARQWTAQVTESARGRAAQMNAGAAQARGEALLFLHGDTVLPPSALDAVRRALDDDTVAGGAFRLRIASERPWLRVIEWGANARSRWLGLPYGDQALFARRDLFNAVGGFPVWPLMEDVEFIRRLRRKGRVALLPEAVVTSARRWEREGLVWTTVKNSLLLAGFYAGIPPQRLAHWRRPVRERGGTMASLGFSKTTPLSYEQAIAKVTDELKKEGFGILTEIDVRETLKKKLNADFRPYKILGACNPPLAHEALKKEVELGMFLPCNVIVYQSDSGQTVVSAVDPDIALGRLDRPQLATIAQEVAARLKRVIAAV